MTDITLNPIGSGYNLSIINSNFSIISNVINNQMLHLSGGNNSLGQDLDMNGYRVLNTLSDPSVPDSMITYAGGDARYYIRGSIPTAVGANDAVGLNQMNLAIAAAAGGTFPANVALYSVLAASGGSALIGHTSGTVKTKLDANDLFITNLAATNGATLVGYTSGVTVKAQLDTNTSGISTLNTTVGTHTSQITTLQGQTAAIANLGKVALATISADQSIPNSTLTTLTLNTFTTNTLGATFTGGGIVIPSGVTKVRITGNLFYASNATGYRDLVIYKNGASISGLPYIVQNAVASLSTLMNGTSCILTVVPGDIFYLVAGQTSGGALNVTAGAQTWLAVEAIN
jgi:hypothetical protein